MKEFIGQNFITILICIIAFAYVITLAMTNQWDRLRAIAYQLILQAERTIRGTKLGRQRFAWVVDQLYSMLPGWCRFFYTKDEMEAQLQEWYDDIKDYLDNGKIDGSIGGAGNVKRN